MTSSVAALDDDFRVMGDTSPLPGLLRPNALFPPGLRHTSLPSMVLPPPLPGTSSPRSASNSSLQSLSSPGSQTGSSGQLSPLGATGTPPSDAWRLTFSQPAAQYLAFNRRLEEKCVPLVIVRFSTPSNDPDGLCLYGTITVKNIAFEKHVSPNWN